MIRVKTSILDYSVSLTLLVPTCKLNISNAVSSMFYKYTRFMDLHANTSYYSGI